MLLIIRTGRAGTRERAFVIVVFLIAIPVLITLVLLALEIARVITVRRELNGLLQSIALQAGTTLVPRLTEGWQKIKLTTEESINNASFGGAALSGFQFEKLDGSDLPGLWSIDDYPRGRATVSAGRGTIEFHLERGFYRYSADDNAFVFDSLENTGAGESETKFRYGLPTYLLFNAVRLEGRYTGGWLSLGRLMGLDALEANAKIIAVADFSYPRPVGPIAIPACELTRNTVTPFEAPSYLYLNGAPANSYTLDGHSNCARPIRIGEGMWTDPSRVDGITRSELHFRTPWRGLAVSGGALWERTQIDPRARLLRGVLGIPSSYHRVMEPAELPDVLERMTSTPPAVEAVLGQPVALLDSYGPISKGKALIDDADLRRTLARWLTHPNPVLRDKRSFAGVFGAETPPTGDVWRLNAPRLRRLRPDYDRLPSNFGSPQDLNNPSVNLSAPWLMQELLLKFPGYAPAFVFPMGDFLTSSAPPWEARLPNELPPAALYNAYSERGPHPFTNPLCHDFEDSTLGHPGVPSNDIWAVRPQSIVAMLVAPENPAVDLCGADSPADEYLFDLLTSDTRPIVVGYLPIWIYDFNFVDLAARYESEGETAPGDFSPLWINPPDAIAAGCIYEGSCSPANRELDFLPRNNRPDSDICSIFGSEGDVTFPDPHPLRTALKGMQVDATDSQYPWKTVRPVCLPGYESISHASVTYSYRARSVQYGCAGFAAMPECPHQDFVMRHPTVLQNPLFIRANRTPVIIPVP